ncbi:transcriptional regulatory protein AlgP-like [Bos mutus]|uniref:transcriptional regulatory protein AlgP-like n=1 Tax=Bos mutus TaxID=72004 RepID=UPI0038B4F53B
MRAASSYCRAGHREGGRGSASGAAGLGAPSQLLHGPEPPRRDFEKVLVPEDGEGGWRARPGARPAEGASGPRHDLRGDRPRAAAPRPPLLPSLLSKRMNQPRPAARPPRFLFSFSTPPAAGAARLHRRSFPGTLPLAPPTARGAARPLLDSTPRSPGATARPGPLSPRRFAAASPRAVPRCSLRGAGVSVCFRGAAGDPCDGSGGKPRVENPPPARPPPRVAPARARPRTWPAGTPHAQRSSARPGRP